MTMIISGSDGLEFPDGSDQGTAFTGNAATITSGTLAVARGGTGLSSVGTAGNFLQSNGTTWVSAANPPPFTSGTLMLFQQTAAPTGWTKQTTHDNKALRVVSGSAGSGGSVGFTAAFASQAVAGSIANTTATNQNTTAGGSLSINTSGLSAGATTLTTSQIPSHNHPADMGNTTGGANLFRGLTGGVDSTTTTGSTGGGGSHTHSISGSATGTFTGTAHSHTQDAHNHSFTGTAINLAVSYVDLIIASKD